MGEERPPLYRENPLGWGGTPKTGTLWEGEQNGVGASPKNGEPYGDLGGIWGLCGAQWGSGGLWGTHHLQEEVDVGPFVHEEPHGVFIDDHLWGGEGGSAAPWRPPPLFHQRPPTHLKNLTLF